MLFSDSRSTRNIHVSVSRATSCACKPNSRTKALMVSADDMSVTNLCQNSPSGVATICGTSVVGTCSSSAALGSACWRTGMATTAASESWSKLGPSSQGATSLGCMSRTGKA